MMLWVSMRLGSVEWVLSWLGLLRCLWAVASSVGDWLD